MAALMSELPQERLTIAITSMAAAQKAFDITRDYTRERKAFGKPIADMQNTRFPARRSQDRARPGLGVRRPVPLQARRGRAFDL